MAVYKINSRNKKNSTQDKQRRFSYAQEKLSAALIELAIGEAGIKSRLKLAYNSELCGLTTGYFPDELKDDWQKIMQALTRLGPRSIKGSSIAISPLSNTLERIRGATGVKIAKRIIDLKYKIDSYLEILESNSE